MPLSMILHICMVRYERDYNGLTCEQQIELFRKAGIPPEDMLMSALTGYKCYARCVDMIREDVSK